MWNVPGILQFFLQDRMLGGNQLNYSRELNELRQGRYRRPKYQKAAKSPLWTPQAALRGCYACTGSNPTIRKISAALRLSGSATSASAFASWPRLRMSCAQRLRKFESARRSPAFRNISVGGESRQRFHAKIDGLPQRFAKRGAVGSFGE